MPSIKDLFTKQAIQSLKKYIREAGGNEVFMVGHPNGEGIVDRVEVYARGNESQAPALLQVAKQSDVVIHNHPGGKLQPSDADMHVASILGNDGIGFYIINNQASNVYVAVEPFKEKKIIPVDPVPLSKLIKAKGPIAKKLDNYEYRHQQVEMIESVCHAINEGKIAVIEAGTGTGKTLAYLLPAITYAVNNKERCVISTNTINLQEQLINKDLPFLQSILKNKFKAVLVKGRSNYVCKRKLANASKHFDLYTEEGEKEELKDIIRWSKTTKDGSKSDMNIMPRYNIWEKIQSESDTSLRTACPYYDTCFFYNARRKAARANILVANHHLLFSDLAIRAVCGHSENAVLPGYDRIIFDEAHNIEDVATDYFGDQITYIGILRILNKLYQKKRNKEKGLLPFLSAKLNSSMKDIPREKLLRSRNFIEDDCISSVENLSALLTSTMEQVFDTIRQSDESEFREKKLRLIPDMEKKIKGWQEKVLSALERLLKEMKHFDSKLSKLILYLAEIESKLELRGESLIIDLQAQSERLHASANTIKNVMFKSDEANVRWIEVREGINNTKIIRFRSAPIEVAPVMKKAVYENYRNIIMTSATLTVSGGFDFLKKRLGLDLIEPERIHTLSLPAPFDYKKQVLVAIPRDIPDPRDETFKEALQDMILKAIEIGHGRAFVLFTSYGLLNIMYKNLQSSIEEKGYNLYKQGNENRHKLLERFKTDISSVLFATDSFWEGVDVHGEALESIIITKLPFKVPNEPVIEARIEAIEQKGGNAFMEYSVPKAVIKFRQGFGRLIRRKSDRGSVLILDNRVINKRYGRIFLDSLPDCNIFARPAVEVFKEMEEFFSKKSVA
ncbi:MAG: helicase C-terminal domain-containing protein [Bacteroidota bacterium]